MAISCLSVCLCLPMSPSSDVLLYLLTVWVEVEEWEPKTTSMTSVRHNVSNHTNLISYVTGVWLVKLEVLR